MKRLVEMHGPSLAVYMIIKRRTRNRTESLLWFKISILCVSMFPQANCTIKLLFTSYLTA